MIRQRMPQTLYQTIKNCQEGGFGLTPFVFNEPDVLENTPTEHKKKTRTLSESLDRSGVWKMTPSLWNH